MNKRLAIILGGVAVLLLAAGGAIYLAHLNPGGAEPSESHHSGGMVALWTAVSVGVFTPLIVGANRRRREKKDREDKS